MSYSYEYDESGLASSYLAVSFLIPATIVFTYLEATKKQKKVLECGSCTKKTQSRMVPRFMLFMLYALLAYFVNNIRTIKMDIKKGFDPLEVLGVSLDASKKTIKKKMQKLLMKYAASKAPEGKKEEYEKKSVDISKAYVIMKNKEDFNSWLNTESKSGEIMAIPDVVMKNALVAFLVYCAILGALLPFYAFRKWKTMRNRNRLGVCFKSVEEILKYFEGDLKKKNVQSMMWVISQSEEYKGIQNVDCNLLREVIGAEYGYPLPDPKTVNNGFFVLCDILFRTNLTPEADRKFIQEKSLGLIECMKNIALVKGQPEVLRNLFTLQAMIVQRVFDEEYFLLQFPTVNFRDLFILKIKKGRIEDCAEDKLRKSLPRIKVEEFVASVKPTGISSEDASDVEDVESLEDNSNADYFSIPKDSLVTVRVRLSTTNSDLCVHSHYLDSPLEHSWVAFITIDNILHKKMIKIDEKSKEINFEFESFGKKKTSEIKLYLQDGYYLKNNQEASILIKYV
ncbi:Protein translocation protein SEC63 [Nosema granulosis]|uniref:Protein translocation protein SEC63 n=1 Tax=Nosema granulosis TaxID=83296 RepID=A0A9P6H004_9MICR|nr:Protein translocation protein SEC63 [Nosema granulosis]